MPRKLAIKDGAVDKGVGARIRAVREKQGLSLKAAAELLNIGFQTLARYEKGDYSPTADVLIRLLKLEPSIDPGWLLEGKGAMNLDSDFSVGQLRSYIFDDVSPRAEELGSQLNSVLVMLAQLPESIKIGECRDFLKWASQAAMEIIGKAQGSQRNENDLRKTVNEIQKILYDKGLMETTPAKKKKEETKKKKEEKPTRRRRNVKV